MTLDFEQVVLALSALGAGAILREVIIAVTQRRKLGADAVAVISAAAAELVEPLRRELAAERGKVAELHHELEAATSEAQHLRAALALARVDADALDACRAGRARDARRIRDLEAQLHR